eukprot:TRINITY_DN20138_c0_g1_i3.p1 TRINITY_DN20138_c0_g1~~TRINITY_DN20138_c0_g1_i3.p1  ORF type:complete len:367 (+),score=119.74 TRINITY_DN20138_c0_g1_i3:171-1271(+)
MGGSLSREDADNAIEVVGLIPNIASLLGAIGAWLICKYVKINTKFFSSKIVMRIAVSVAFYSFVNCFSPSDDGTSLPVITDECYAQSVLLIACENLTYFWQCALMHNIYEVAVLKNLRPEALLIKYDTMAVVFAFCASLAPWMVSGYGWLWFGRCKYSSYDSGNASKIFTDLIHLCCIIYVLHTGIKMRWSHYLETLMNPDYKMEQAIQRHRRTQQKFITLTWAWAFCRVWRILVSIINVFEYAATGQFLSIPEDIPFIIVLLEAFATEVLGLLLFGVLFLHDWKSIRTQLLGSKYFSFLRKCYCWNKELHIEKESTAINTSRIEHTLAKEAELQKIIRGYPFECNKGARGSDLSLIHISEPTRPY